MEEQHVICAKMALWLTCGNWDPIMGFQMKPFKISILDNFIDFIQIVLYWLPYGLYFSYLNTFQLMDKLQLLMLPTRHISKIMTFSNQGIFKPQHLCIQTFWLSRLSRLSREYGINMVLLYMILRTFHKQTLFTYYIIVSGT